MKINKHQVVLSAFVCVWVATALAPMVLSIASLHIIILAGLVGILIWENLPDAAKRSLLRSPLYSSTLARGEREPVAGDEELKQFKMDFRKGPLSAERVSSPGNAPVIPGVLSAAPSAEAKAPVESSRDPLKEFFAWAPEQVAAMKKLIEKTREGEIITRERRDTLAEIEEKVAELKRRACIPELQPAWQVASGLDGLLKQLTSRADNINQSTLRTIAGSIELLGDLSVPGVRPDIAVNPPIRILAVDDDPVTRFALASAVKKAFDQPEVAENGVVALDKIKRNRYDLIMLDVMMPEMDGFEVCGRIRQTAANGSTPVLFVTALKDFDSRSRLLTMGSTDLMGKPFITFEVAVKALTLALRSRLHEVAGESASGNRAVSWSQALPAAESEPQPASMTERPVVLEEEGLGNNTNSVSLIPPTPLLAKKGDAKAEKKSDTTIRAKNLVAEFNPEFLVFMGAFVDDVKRQITTIAGSKADADRQERITRLHLRLQTLSRAISAPELRPAFELCSAVEGMCLKLKNDSRAVTPSALRTAREGLDLLRDLCAPGIRGDLLEKPAIRVMVVDDEPLARRALAGALQMKLPRPDSVESAEFALGLAAEKEFDVVFLDVCMPGMNGFTACTKLHETALNRTTPVVFVTSHSDGDFRAQAKESGGTDFVVKPFDFIEIPVKALTYVLRGRLEKAKKTQPPAAAPSP